MKLRKLTLVLAVVVTATLVVAGSAAADPPKEDFYFRWGSADYELWMEYGEDFCPIPTGEAWHSECGTWPFYVVDSTNPLISGVYIWDTENLHGLEYDPWYGFWPQPEIHGTWVILPPEDVDGYWEGTFQTVGNYQGGYHTTIAQMVGEGHGVYEGWLLKGTHWYDPAEPGTSPYGDFWPVLSGQLIRTGQAK